MLNEDNIKLTKENQQLKAENERLLAILNGSGTDLLATWLAEDGPEAHAVHLACVEHETELGKMSKENELLASKVTELEKKESVYVDNMKRAHKVWKKDNMRLVDALGRTQVRSDEHAEALGCMRIENNNLVVRVAELEAAIKDKCISSIERDHCSRHVPCEFCKAQP